MTKEFLPYEQALALKELGFDEECIASYDNKGDFKDPFEYNSEKTNGYVTNSSLKDPKNFNASSNPALLKNYLDNPFTAAPLYQQAFRWFREKYVLDSTVQPTYSTKYQYRLFNTETKSKVQVYGDYMGKEFNTYEEAELACLIKLIEIVKSK
jgi:hypothetical protein